jgi:hypothetical protein
MLAYRYLILPYAMNYRLSPGPGCRRGALPHEERRAHQVQVRGISSWQAAFWCAECEPINFDPPVKADGIEPTKDPVLLFLSPAYAVSFAKQFGGK